MIRPLAASAAAGSAPAGRSNTNSPSRKAALRRSGSPECPSRNYPLDTTHSDMKKVTILVLLSLCVLPVRAQNRFRAAVIEPAAPTAETGLIRHPWTGKKVLFIGDSISDCVASHIVDRHYYDWLSDWLGITAYVPAISGWQMKDVEAEVGMFQATAPGVQPDMICIFLGTNDYNSGIRI